MLDQNCLDLAQFDAEAAQFHLMVQATQVLQRAIFPVADPISGFVNDRMRRGVRRYAQCSLLTLLLECTGHRALRPYRGDWIGHKSFRCQTILIPIAWAETEAANVEFARDSYWDRTLLGIENVELGVGDGLANRNNAIL